MLGIAYAASMGGIGSKIGTGTNLVFVKEARRSLGLEVSFPATAARSGSPRSRCRRTCG
jgi:hypothetical protein